MKLSVVIPVYNEKTFLGPVLSRVQEVELDGIRKEIVVVDDYSTDGTRELLEEIQHHRERGVPYRLDNEDGGRELQLDNINVLFQSENYGKGRALQTGFEHASGDVVVVQDADLEYDPVDYHELIEPIRRDEADVVYGSRFLGGPHRVLYFWHYQGNRFLTLLSNMLTNLNLSDMETGYKMFRAEVLEDIEIQQNRFGVEPELTAKIARQGWRIYEVPISYHGRTYEEGKKITWVDGLKAIWCIIKYNFTG